MTTPSLHGQTYETSHVLSPLFVLPGVVEPKWGDLEHLLMVCFYTNFRR